MEMSCKCSCKEKCYSTIMCITHLYHHHHRPLDASMYTFHGTCNKICLDTKIIYFHYFKWLNIDYIITFFYIYIHAKGICQYRIILIHTYSRRCTFYSHIWIMLHNIWTIGLALPVSLPSRPHPKFANRTCSLFPEPWIDAVGMKLGEKK